MILFASPWQSTPCSAIKYPHNSASKEERVQGAGVDAVLGELQ